MAQSLTLPVAGLMTDPGPFTAAPDGGMVEAQNVVVVRPGVLEPRPGLTNTRDSSINTPIHIYADDDGDTWVWDDANEFIRKNGTTTITGPDSFIRGKVRVCATGGRALFTTEDGVCTLPTQPASPAQGSATVAYRAGMPQPFAPRLVLTTASTTSALANDSAMAYRFTLRRRLANGTIVESPPTLPCIVRNLALGNSNVVIEGPTGGVYYGWRTDGYPGFGDLIDGDELCVYRSAAITPYTATPSDEMRLRTTIVFASGSFSTYTDTLPDAAWTGAALYTNATQESAALANYRPEYARDIALYNGMTFYAGAKTAQTLSLTLKSVGGAYDQQQTLRSHSFASGDIAVGSPTISTVSAADISSLAVGQVITRDTNAPGSADAYFPANTYITAINAGAGTVTVNANALATQVGAGLIGWDWFETTISGVTTRFYAMLSGFAAAPTNNFQVDDDISAFGTYRIGGPQDIDNRFNGALTETTIQLRLTAGTYGYSSYRNMTFQFYTIGQTTTFTVKSSKPLAWDRYVDSVTGVTSQQTGGIAELQWSKTNEPEHCPLPYRTVIGDAAYAIRRIIPARNSLLIFKDDGLYQWFGETPTDYRIEMLDRTLVLPAPSTSYDEQSKHVGSLGDVVYAMTTRGPMAITDTGAQPVGGPIMESLRRYLSSAMGSADTQTRAMMTDAQNGRVGFFYYSSDKRAYVLDVVSGQWVYWKFDSLDGGPSGFATKKSTGEPLFCSGDRTYTFQNDRRPLADATGATFLKTYDDTGTVTVSTVTGTGPYTITLSAPANFQPGDIIGGASVTAQNSATEYVSDTSPGTGSKTYFTGYECRCIWVGRAEGNPGTEKHWRSVLFPFELSAATARMKLYVSGYRNIASAYESDINAAAVNGASPWANVPTMKRAKIPTAFGRDWAIKVGFTMRVCGGWFSTGGVSLLFENVAPDKAAP